MTTTAWDEDAMVAAVDALGRAGATEIEIGYQHDDVPCDEAGWYASARWQGTRLTSEGPGPVEAAESLARRVLTGGQCTHCGEEIALGGTGPGCRWTRFAQRWERGCRDGVAEGERLIKMRRGQIR